MIDFVIASANDEEDIRRAVYKNAARGLPIVELGKNRGSISVCGNGPSVKTEFPTEGQIVALNGAWRSLAKNGVMPDIIMAHDPSPENIAWFDDAPIEPLYLLSSQVHPDIFDHLKNHSVNIWHLDDKFEQELKLFPRFQAGFSIGCYALHVLNAMGFSHFDCYGYDSCYSLAGEHHATYQPWRISPPKPYQVGEQMFIAEPWMAAQVQEFLKQIEANRYNYTVDVKGNGYLAAALRHNTLEVLYDLNYAPGSYDFLCAMINVENHRQEHGFSRVHVNFKPGQKDGFRPIDVIEVPSAYQKLMLNNVARPMLEMFAFREVAKVGERPFQCHYIPLESLIYYRKTGKMAHYRPNDAALEWAKQYDNPYVITLREAEHHPLRNSKVDEWIKFAKTLDGPVVFVRDTVKAYEPIDGFETCPKASIDIHKRMALYQRAKMNFSVGNGPITLAAFTKHIPYLYLLTPVEGYRPYEKQWQIDVMGLDDNCQFPWHDPKCQRIEHADDTAENLVRIYREMRERPNE